VSGSLKILEKMNVLILTISTILVSCSINKYASLDAANQACLNWKRNGITFKHKTIFGNIEVYSRFCEYDGKKQILGWENSKAEKGKVHQNYPERIIKKRFHF